MGIPISFLHTSPAAIPPLMQYYSEKAPELEITNQLDDGLLRFLARGNAQLAERRLGEMLAIARDLYEARAVMVTCSSVTMEIVTSLGQSAGIPLIKIDNPMAEEAVRAGRRLAVMATFPPTVRPTTDLLKEAARRSGVVVELEPVVLPDAYQALLAGNPERHDEILFNGISEAAQSGVDGIVLAQVSMARLLPKVEGEISVPVFSSLPSSLRRVRELLS